LNMESVYHFVTIRVNETSWAHVWRLRSHYLEMGYDIQASSNSVLAIIGPSSTFFFTSTFTTKLPISTDITRVT
jgi:hypothetical protein